MYVYVCVCMNVYVRVCQFHSDEKLLIDKYQSYMFNALRICATAYEYV